MSKIAILGDIHANLQALETVLADSRSEGVDEYLCTGDVIVAVGGEEISSAEEMTRRIREFCLRKAASAPGV